MPKPTRKLDQLRSQLNAANLERSGIIDGLLATLLAGGNAVLFGPPGTAKSDLLRSLCHAIDGATYFQRLLQRAMPPEELLGQISLKALEADTLKRNTEHRLPKAHIAFLDEIFKCSPTVLNSLLGLLNERVFENPEPEQVPLEFVCGAANRVPDEPELAPFVDRFIYRPLVPYLKRERNRETLLEWTCDGSRPAVDANIISLSELHTYRQSALKMPFSPELRTVYMKVLSQLSDAGFQVSDRRMVQLVRLLRCYAYVQGDGEVFIDHLHDLLPQCLWRQEDAEIREIAKILKNVCPATESRLREVQQALNVVSDQISQLIQSYDPDQIEVHKQSCERQSSELSKLEQLLLDIEEQPSRQQARQMNKAKAYIQDLREQLAEVKELAYS